ncbi:hypothetical protein D7X94_03525 [Acutalibacter sp. 1XD8-33]|nr:hypothetical protein D7X94_03525 [Acutalibacter sp. 1XD8-33]
MAITSQFHIYRGIIAYLKLKWKKNLEKSAFLSKILCGGGNRQRRLPGPWRPTITIVNELNEPYKKAPLRQGLLETAPVRRA